MTIWQHCHGPTQLKQIKEEPFRVVESQSTLYCRNLVDTNEEYEILEHMLEASKPPISSNTNYLIFTPFRYPPLKHGSRFGQRFEQGLWYGSLDIETALAEVAYYRLLFFSHSTADLGFINLPLTAFNANIKTNQGIDLCLPPFSAYEKKLSSKTSYADSQAIGTDMRNANVEAFIFQSARSTTQGKNIAAYTQKAFVKKKGHYTFNHTTWHCLADKISVVFSNINREKYSFSIKDFSLGDSIATNPEWP